MEPFAEAFQREGLPYEFLDMSKGAGFALSQAPPTGVFFARPSPSLHIRGHRFAMESTAALVDYLEGYGRRVVNGSKAIGHEQSKIKQELTLKMFGVNSPDTKAATSRAELRRLLEARGKSEEGQTPHPFLQAFFVSSQLSTPSCRNRSMSPFTLLGSSIIT